MDGWSVQVIAAEFSELYNAALEKRKPILPELKIQYVDYAIWQQALFTNDVSIQNQIAFWKENLKNKPDILNFPTDYDRPEILSFNGEIINFKIHKEEALKLRDLGRSSDATLFMTFMAAFQILLYRYSLQEDILVGIPIANRNNKQIENLIGFFVNTLVIRGRISEDLTVRDFIRQIRQTSLAAYGNQDVPFEYLVEHLEVVRRINQNPIFQVMLAFNQENNLNESPDDTSILNGLHLKRIETEYHTSQFDLTFHVFPQKNGEIDCSLEFSTNLFKRQTIQRMTKHFKNTIENMILYPDHLVTHLPMLTKEEVEAQLYTRNKMEIFFQKDKLFLHLFDEQVEKIPENIAVQFGDKKLTYKELDQKSNQIAWHLKELNAGQDIPIIIYLKRSLDLITAMVGVMKSGSAFLPIDSDYPVKRLKTIIEDIHAPILITQKSLKERLKHIYDRDMVVIDDSETKQIISSQSVRPLKDNIAKHNLAYIIYTSGSTGNPKGILQKHETLSHFLQSMQERIQITEHDIVLQHTTITFDISVEEIFHTLMKGAKLSILEPGMEKFADAIIEHIRNNGCTVLHTVPSMMKGILEIVEKKELAGLPLNKVLVGGEALTIDLVEKFYNHLPKAVLYNVYGPAEAPYTTTWKCENNKSQKTMPIGKQLPHLSLYILDKNRQLIPEGIAGEVWVGGTGLAIGYTDEKLTKERFLENSFLTEEEKVRKKIQNVTSQKVCGRKDATMPRQ